MSEEKPEQVSGLDRVDTHRAWKQTQERRRPREDQYHGERNNLPEAGPAAGPWFFWV